MEAHTEKKEIPFLEMLLNDEIRELFEKDTMDEKSIDQTGYDIRLGHEIAFVSRGKTIEDCTKIEIYPGETILVKSEEVLTLPDNVCALGAPKMKLLVKGLWAHGGKTDFGYNQRLTLSFRHVGSSRLELKRGDPIFHLTFFKVHGKKTIPYSGEGLGFPQMNLPPLEGTPLLSARLEEETKQIEGIQISRVVHLIRIEISSLKVLVRWGAVFSVVTVALAMVALLVPAAAIFSIIGIAASALLNLLLDSIKGLFRRRKPNVGT
jgi:deoxycytidine triphosphate deaminase